MCLEICAGDIGIVGGFTLHIGHYLVSLFTLSIYMTCQFSSNKWQTTWNTDLLSSKYTSWNELHIFTLYKGELLFSSDELVEDIVPNIKCGPWLCYWGKMHHIFAQYRFRVYFNFNASDFKKNTLHIFKFKKQTLSLDLDFVIGVKCTIFWLNKLLRVYFYLYATNFWKSTFK